MALGEFGCVMVDGVAAVAGDWIFDAERHDLFNCHVARRGANRRCATVSRTVPRLKGARLGAMPEFQQCVSHDPKCSHALPIQNRTKSNCVLEGDACTETENQGQRQKLNQIQALVET